MAILKLHLDEFNEIDYELIAIHSSLEDYRLAYFLNQKLPIILSKSKKLIEVHSKFGAVLFAPFTFRDASNDIEWFLVQNKNESIVRKRSTVQNLFFDKDVEIETKIFLLSEYKKVDYFLKIDNNQNNLIIENVIKEIKTIPNITAVYAVNPNHIKSKNNLIF